ncbi:MULTISPECIES: tRNA (adenosine(37)-N6)-threonylcarbamoyltransferase complex dimerization subunit type 1 TsaB [unclassified Sphingomonas]|uniref:tRNA (adenosine(37)-N6)-threonylcarbamoyltransferase complex dimerization subunit type 1 TsaB n=1 Tax=unclassified Sphingomonas TaxID=196159 RepID=UPI00092C1F12|nr:MULTISPECIES: tRNA (adenosine(37)-N6)-threonylcarbamoyltransferase complex dimerization subunit type 1 TsaB [unclassified Sphingomonas]MBN8847036.1 tRNA (adenosine(37)-N6)-threonylcarbamoyltransferase complex dimerization subunit type 1 TsaB [Sphingomonas sp.]OJV33135.1 MAG: tRNA (adenosine(37)-N6)-threonylcarbamoyltransferase complex dimerization subunit type 1 TsaB [Sphingomonas sp. 67-36]
MRTLVIDTATAACSVALIEDGRVVDARHEVVGRGHAERLVPMIAELADGGRADRILVDVGPGSFTGIRVGIAAARGLALGWRARVAGYSSTALIAAAAIADGVPAPLAVVLEGGHGELFMQGYVSPLAADGPLASLPPADALAALAGRPAVGSGVRWLAPLDVELTLHDMLPDAARATLLPPALADLPARPLYGRAPDAKLPA